MARTLVIGCAVAAAIGLLPLPYAYYVLLRLAFFVSLLVLGYAVYERSQAVTPSLIVICLLAVLYNPVFLLKLGSKTGWILVNFATLCFMFWTLERASTRTSKT